LVPLGTVTDMPSMLSVTLLDGVGAGGVGAALGASAGGFPEDEEDPASVVTCRTPRRSC
jgi:hypothetical protein